ncbi:hypothetical protein [Cellulomonas aerilata]|nr:hypothetical protein [Cellulomonas aerilata]
MRRDVDDVDAGVHRIDGRPTAFYYTWARAARRARAVRPSAPR